MQLNEWSMRDEYLQTIPRCEIIINIVMLNYLEIAKLSSQKTLCIIGI